MELFNVQDFKGGWFVGNFKPTIIDTKNFEVSIKHYKQGQEETEHYHKLSDEITVIVEGTVTMNGTKYTENDIILIKKGESTDFKCLTDTITCVVKIPSEISDKYIVDNHHAKIFNKS